MSVSTLAKTLSFAIGTSLVVGATTIAPARATTLTGFQTIGAEMAGMKVTVNFLNGTSDTQIWSVTGGSSGAASGSDWSLTQSGDTFNNPWNLSYTGSDSIISMAIDAIPGNAVFDTISGPFLTPGSFNGKPFTVQFGLAPTSFNYSVPIDISQGDLFGKLSLFWANGFTANNRLSFLADTDSGTTDDPVIPKDVPEPASVLGLLTLGLLGAGSSLKGKKEEKC